jgi:hypothetical protein
MQHQRQETEQKPLQIARSKPTRKDNIKIDFEKICGVRDWTDLAQDMIQWRALLNMLMNFQIPQMQGILSAAKRLPASQKNCVRGVDKVFLILISHACTQSR